MKKRGKHKSVFCLLALLLSVLLLISCSSIDENSGSSTASTIYGKVVDQNNKPIAGEIVIAQWTIENKVHEAQTTTLTKEEAIRLGDAGLEGLFLFSRGEINAPAQIPITIKTLPRYTSIRVQSAPGQAVDAGRMMLLRSSAPPLTQEEKNREVVEIVSTKTQFSLPSQASHPKWWMGVIYVSLILLMLGYFYVKRRKKKKSVELFVFKRDIEALNTMKVEDLMVKDVITISPDASVQDALELMMHHHINGVVVTEHNKVRGILTETDFLRKVYGSTNLHELKVREVMTSPILTVSSTSTVISVVKLMLKRSIRKIPVVKGTELVGIISFTDAFRLFNTFFSNHPQERQSAIKTAKECAHKEMTVVNKQDSLQEVMVLMREKNVSCVLVSQTVQKSTQSIVAKEEEMGIITTKDLLEELYKNPHAFDHLKAINVMRSPLFLMDHDKTIAEAVEIMVTNSIRRLPVVSHNKLIGMITQPALLSAVIGHLENMGGKRP